MYSMNSTLNKSELMRFGLLNDKKIQEYFFSEDEHGGIYPMLSKILFSPKTPGAIRNKYPDVVAFTNEIFARKITREKLAELKLEHDSSLYAYIKLCAHSLIIDEIKKSKREPLANSDDFDADVEAKGEDPYGKFENNNLLRRIIADANLNAFQTFIIEYGLKGYDAEEIVDLYSERNNRSISMNYYYAQKSTAMKRLKEAGQYYKKGKLR